MWGVPSTTFGGYIASISKIFRHQFVICKSLTSLHCCAWTSSYRKSKKLAHRRREWANYCPFKRLSHAPSRMATFARFVDKNKTIRIVLHEYLTQHTLMSQIYWLSSSTSWSAPSRMTITHTLKLLWTKLAGAAMMKHVTHALFYNSFSLTVYISHVKKPVFSIWHKAAQESNCTVPWNCFIDRCTTI